VEVESVKKGLLYGFVCVGVLALGLTCWTFQRFLDSYRTLQLFDVELREVTQKPQGVGEYSAVVRFSNQGPVATSVDGFYVLLQWDRRLIAVSTVHPDGLVVPSGGESLLTLDFSSNLAASDLPVLSGADKGRWTVKLYMRLGHPERRRSFRLDMEKRL
jgi:hypothetical protein